MKRYLKIVFIEISHLTRSPFKIISLIFYLLAVIYGCQNGYNLFKKHNNEIISIKANYEDQKAKMLFQYEEIEKGTLERPRRDPTIPYWAIWNTPSYAFKYPSPMMVFSLGQSEQYGYYKKVTNWSTTFDNDLAEEIANPERLSIGTLDFNFVLIYLTPILLIIMLFNIGGLEIDLKFIHLIYVNNISKKEWLIARFTFYFILVIILLFTFLLPFGLLSGVFQNELINFLKLSLLIFVYVLAWFSIFYIINYWGNGSPDQALKMISTWLAFCIIIPGAFHQFSSLKYSANYMTDYLDVSRNQKYEIFDLSTDILQTKLLESFPNLRSTLHANDTTLNKSVINRSISGIVNTYNKKVSHKIETSKEAKNQFVKSYFLLNPVIYFQNKINAFTKTDYYAYREYRKHIQFLVDKKINFILEDTWNNVIVNKEKYLQYVRAFKQKHE
jgi:ABC-2 type transport system permease protein